MNANNMKIGEIRSMPHMGIDIICMEGNVCEECVFKYSGGCHNANCEAGDCLAEGREDNKEVYFLIHKEPTECED